jgi:hypothetical protein
MSAAILAAQPAPSPGDSASKAGGAVYNGRAGQLTVRIPRFDVDIPVDGTLTASVWKEAAVLTGFSEYMPVDGLPAEDSTEVLVWYSPNAIYFGFRAFETHGPVHATLANRDMIDGDDNFQIILSPFLHARQSSVFAANPFGIQEDGTITEGAIAIGVSSYGIAGHVGPPPTDLSPDFVYESKGRLTSFGYELVVRIPFRSVKYQSQDPQDWGINILRNVQHSGQQQSWYPAHLAAASFLLQAGTLVGLTGLHRGLALDLNPFVTETVSGGPPPGAASGWQYTVARPAFGANVRWGISNNLLLNATLRPDFAEVESDATQVQYDPRNAVYYPEKRPFFLDGLEQFNTPNNLIYTRQIQAPIGAVKLTGKFGDVAVAYLGAQDDEGSPTSGGFGHPIFNLVRVLADVGASSQVGAVITSREDYGSFNRVAGIDGRIPFADVYSMAFQVGGSTWRNTAAVTGDSLATNGAGPIWQAHFIRAGRTFGMNYNIMGIDPEFEAGSGFISRNGIVNLNLDQNYTLYGRPHDFIQTIAGDAALIDTWVYRRFTAGQSLEDARYHLTATTTLYGGWQLGTAVYWETYGYDPSLYANYYLGHGSGSSIYYTPFVGTPFIPNTDIIFTLTTPQFSRFFGSITYISGRDENFYEWSSADIGNTNMTLNWRPTNQLRVNATYIANFYHRHSDGSLVARQYIPRMVVEYQLSQPIFFRIVAQYDAVYQDSLRDDSRTNLPIYLFSPTTGIYSRASAFTNNTVQFQALFAYQPVPGTVAFVGYGNNLYDPQTFDIATLQPTSVSFFVKFSYLFRL